ncbi:Transmembrane domain-containing protein [Orpheovirus IHUMI-LCC2]|uniref:Transmembrane domain-containing protein n=1 Tax=Orpheovirus IHUMI-LCC2 TaxID=2023057 RepID=A0A2I2L3M5_9VIRU|nr:Transmembrane domain-containing protein [Orpheovirus IHUMI-LCC2]SNW62123.1 Transmembrane domain-containing protein [Orpheovirus IHUMI-LCC2]
MITTFFAANAGLVAYGLCVKASCLYKKSVLKTEVYDEMKHGRLTLFNVSHVREHVDKSKTFHLQNKNYKLVDDLGTFNDLHNVKSYMFNKGDGDKKFVSGSDAKLLCINGKKLQVQEENLLPNDYIQLINKYSNRHTLYVCRDKNNNMLGIGDDPNKLKHALTHKRWLRYIGFGCASTILGYCVMISPVIIAFIYFSQ